MNSRQEKNSPLHWSDYMSKSSGYSHTNVKILDSLFELIMKFFNKNKRWKVSVHSVLFLLKDSLVNSLHGSRLTHHNGTYSLTSGIGDSFDLPSSFLTYLYLHSRWPKFPLPFESVYCKLTKSKVPIHFPLKTHFFLHWTSNLNDSSHPL